VRLVDSAGEPAVGGLLDARAMQSGAKYRRCKELSDMLFRTLAASGAATIRPDFRGALCVAKWRQPFFLL
jgi:hypothetical protein